MTDSENLQKKILMVALDFPPCQSAGVQRTLKFFDYLPEMGWQPIVLTATKNIYDRIDESALSSIEGNDRSERIFRAFGINTVKHLSLYGKHFHALTLPDRFFPWYWGGVHTGKKIIKQHKPSVIWSTFPCPTAHNIALNLKRKSRLPWIADFRDPFAGNNPAVRAKNKPGQLIDQATVQEADLLVFTTHKAAALYRQVYPDLQEEKVVVIQNGFNEEVFGTLLSGKSALALPDQDTYTLLHSGALYDGGRDPRALFRALNQLKKIDSSLASKLKVVFRGVPEAGQYAEVLAELGIEHMVEFCAAVSYQQSIEEMLSADALLLLQGTMFNNQIPGKVYEYIRAKKPILALTDKQGATSMLLSEIEHTLISDMNNTEDIAATLVKLADVKVDKDFRYEQYSRKAKTQQLAAELTRLYDSYKKGE